MADAPTSDETCFQYLGPVTNNVSGLVPHEGVPQASPTVLHGFCKRCRTDHRLISDGRTKGIAQRLMTHFQTAGPPTHEGKMFGVLLGRDQDGREGWLKAFSGRLNGHEKVDGWVPPAIQHDSLKEKEAATIAKLDALTGEISLVEADLAELSSDARHHEYAVQRKALKREHQARRSARKVRRESTHCPQQLNMLDEESRSDSREWRAFVQEERGALEPLRNKLERLQASRTQLRRARRAASQELQSDMHKVHSLRGLDGTQIPVNEFFGSAGGIPTGTGDCCAPKLLQYCALHDIVPLGLEEFWWGPTSLDGSKVQGRFYLPCVEKCEPIMGALLCGLVERGTDEMKAQLTIVYEDSHIAVIEKPNGLLSVPGRGSSKFDCIQNRAAKAFPFADGPLIVHRLDLETSGLMVLALNAEAHRALSKQFARRTVQKTYVAVLEAPIHRTTGRIELAFRFDPDNRPRQTHDPVDGKLGVTDFEVLETNSERTRILFRPLTGRTHQLRLHASHKKGLGVAILGDQLYSERPGQQRLHLHAAQLSFHHPVSGDWVSFESKVPF